MGNSKFSTLLSPLLLPALMASLLAEEPAVTKPVVLENFESCNNNVRLARDWHKPRHGGGTKQTLETTIKSGGKQALKWEYSITKEAATHIRFRNTSSKRLRRHR